MTPEQQKMVDSKLYTRQPEGEPPVRSSELLGAMYRGSDGAMTCALCNCEMEWGECGDCGGEGGHDGYEEDPLWYQPGEIYPCGMCNGKGGEWYCETKDCPTGSGWRVIPAPQAPNAAGELQPPAKQPKD